MGPGSAAHHAVKNGALRCVRGTQRPARAGHFHIGSRYVYSSSILAKKRISRGN
jgi:hypothetical protein